MVSFTIMEVNSDSQGHHLLSPVRSPSSEETTSSTIPKNNGSASPGKRAGSNGMDSAPVLFVHGLSSEGGMIPAVPEDTGTSPPKAGTQSSRHNHGSLSPVHSHVNDNGSISPESIPESTSHGHGMPSPITSPSSEEEVSATVPESKHSVSPGSDSNINLVVLNYRSSVHSPASDEDVSFKTKTVIHVDESPPQLNRTPPELSNTLSLQSEPVVAERLHSAARLASQKDLSRKTIGLLHENSSSKVNSIAQKRVTFKDNPVSEELLFSEADPVALDDVSFDADTEDSLASNQDATASSKGVPLHQRRGVNSGKTRQTFRGAVASHRTSYDLTSNFLAQYPSLAIETLGGLSSRCLPTGEILIDSMIAATTLLVRDVDASWQFYHEIFPQAWFKRCAARSFSMLFAKDTEREVEQRSSLEFTEITVEVIVDPDEARFYNARPEDTPMDIVVKLISRGPMASATYGSSLQSDAVFPETTSISNALLRSPEWRADATMEMDSRDISWPAGRRLDFTDLDGYGWRVLEARKTIHLW